MNPGQQTQAAGNRITFTSQPLPNGSVGISGSHHHSGTGPTIISTSQLPNTTTIKTITSSASSMGHQSVTQQVQHHQVMQQSQNAQQQSQPQQQSGNPQILNSMIPANVVVGMRPQTAQSQNAQARTVQGRVVIGGPQMVNARPQNPGGITLSTISQGQAPALLLKTDAGFQLFRVGNASAGPVTQTIGTNSTNPTQIRLHTVPAAQQSIATTASTSNNIVVNSSSNSAVHTYSTQASIALHQQQPTTVTAGNQQHFQQQTQHLHSQPQITQIQTIPPQSVPSSQQPQQQVNSTTTMSSNNSTNITGPGTSNTTAPQTTTAQGNTKEKCRKFLANLIDLSTREPKPVERNVRTLIQELVNANVEPEEFCDRLERLLNASPQPCLIGFLKKSLPLLRQALYTKELIIEGIKPPPHHVVGMATLQQQLPKIQAQIRPISQTTTTIGQTQVRMISPSSAAGGPRPIGHTTITKQPPGLRIQAPTNAPRLVSAQIRGPIHQQAGSTAQLQNTPTQANIVQIRAPSASATPLRTTVQVRTTKGKVPTTGGITHVKVGQTQIKAIASPTLNSQPPSLTAISSNHHHQSQQQLHHPTLVTSASASMLTSINSVVNNTTSGHANALNLPTPSLPTVQLPPVAAAISNSLDTTKIELKPVMNNSISSASTISSPLGSKIISKTIVSAVPKASSKKKKDSQDKDDKTLSAGIASSMAASSAFFQQPSLSMSSSLYGDDDINDVAAMGGVNLAEESQRILGCTENIGTQIRSCKDEVFLHLPALHARIRAMVTERGLEEPSQDVAVLISHACQERLKNIVEKLAVIAEHRNDVIKLDPRYEVTKDVRGQIKFLEELDKAEQKRHEELEREMLLRAAKSRSKIEDPEQAKMKARAKEMQRAEMEELRQRDANMTALQAIGPRKKLKLDGGEAVGVGSVPGVSSALGSSGTAPAPLRPRIKRVNLRDMLFYMEQERDTCRSQMLYKAYLK